MKVSNEMKVGKFTLKKAAKLHIAKRLTIIEEIRQFVDGNKYNTFTSYEQLYLELSTS